MNIRQTMLHLSGGLLLLLTPACTSEVDLEGGQPLEVTAEIVSSLPVRSTLRTMIRVALVRTMRYRLMVGARP